MSTELTFKSATRQGVKPLIGLYGESGCGKTMSALLLARGIVGPQGKIGMGDTETGRGELYSDVIPGGYQVCPLSAPFTPHRYIDFLDVLEAHGFDIGIIDSGSHEWEGIGGVLEMAGDVEHKTGKPGLHCWRTPKLEHQKFMLRLLQSKVPLIICLRAKYKSRQVRNERGKNEIVKDDYTSPIQAEDFIFEMTAHAEVLRNHSIILTKCSHPDLRNCFPKDNTEPLSIAHGEAIAKWASGGKASAPPPAAPKSSPEVVRLKKQLFALTKDAHNGDQELFWSCLKSACAIDEQEYETRALPEQRLIECIEKMEAAQ